jgi:hypothetical protein
MSHPEVDLSLPHYDKSRLVHIGTIVPRPPLSDSSESESDDAIECDLELTAMPAKRASRAPVAQKRRERRLGEDSDLESSEELDAAVERGVQVESEDEEPEHEAAGEREAAAEVARARVARGRGERAGVAGKHPRGHQRGGQRAGVQQDVTSDEERVEPVHGPAAPRSNLVTRIKKALENLDSRLMTFR